MKKKIILLVIMLIILLPLTGIFLDNQVKKSQLKYWLTDNGRNYTNYDSIKCGIFSLNYAFVDTYEENYVEIYFHKIDFFDLFFPSNINWEANYIGGTDITNTTFPELVAMVKEDCSQFQQSKGNHTDETVNWSYSEYIPEPEPVELSPEQQAIKERWELGKELRLELSWMTEEEKKYVEEKYGITLYSSMDELLEWHKKAVEDGFFKY